MESLYMTETYIGKSDNLIKCEELLDIMIKRQRSNLKSDMNKYPENKELENLLKKQFGFRDISVYWAESLIFTPVENSLKYNQYAYTICGLNFIQTLDNSVDNHLFDSDKGFYNTRHNIFPIINVSTFLVNGFTTLRADHILAIILHEIGHNLSISPYNYVKGILLLYTDAIAFVLSEISSKPEIKGVLNQLINIPTKLIDYFPKLKELWYHIQKINGVFMDILSFLNIPNFMRYLKMMSIAPAMLVRSIASRELEHEADSFTSSYGYSIALVESLDILNANGKSGFGLNHSNILTNVIYDISNVMSTLTNDILGNHPSDMARTARTIQKINADLKSNDIPPKIRKELEEQLDSLLDIINNYNEYMNHPNYLLSELINNIYAKILKIRLK